MHSYTMNVVFAADLIDEQQRAMRVRMLELRISRDMNDGCGHTSGKKCKIELRY